MASQKVTIKDIAKLAGVSTATVSFVINGREGVSKATKERIQKIVKDMDFQPSAASQRLVLRKSFNIALIYPPSASPFKDFFYYDVASGLTEELSLYNYNVVFAPLVESGNEYVLPNIVKRQDADGAILLYDAPANVLDKLDEIGIPYVLVDWHQDGKDRPYINSDIEQAIHNAVMYLIDKGHTQIAYLGSDQLPYYYLRCFQGYQNAMFNAQLPIYPGWINNSAHDAAATFNIIKKLMSLQMPPTAICGMRDMCAIFGIHAATELGISMPEQLSFISIDDISVSRYVYPKLTTVSYNKNELSKTAADMLMRMINGESVDSVVIRCDTIKERQSVATIK